MARIEQTRTELERHLADELSVISVSCEAFDQGRPALMRAAATSLRKLFHSRGRSHALLAQLGLLDSTRWLDTAGQLLEHNLATTFNLVIVRMTFVDDNGNAEARWHPVLDDYEYRTMLRQPTGSFGTASAPAAGRRLPFDDWWTMPVFRDGARQDFSRQDIVMTFTNEDGGAHIDSAIDEAYYRLTRENSLGMGYGDAPGDHQLDDNPANAAIRQICHEVLRSLPRRMMRSA